MTADLAQVAGRGVVLLGCGKMGSALLEGWLAAGLPPSAAHVQEPHPSDAVADFSARGAQVNGPLPAAPAAVVLAVKPQMMAEALAPLAPLAGGETLFLSIAAGLKLAWFEAALGAETPIVRAMPNTPAAVGRGATALIANAAGARFMPLAEGLAGAVGETAPLETEAQMDAVTALSGSGPAYVFHMIEALAGAGVAEGLPEDLAMRLARATVCGAGELAWRSAETAEALRRAVTSPGGTTQAGLGPLMDPETGLPPLMRRTVAAAAARSRELGG
ncbi:MAG: pyrroline-5-carboxylate reductase [Rubrimonas sp.]|uniref:pyrroline-5-carboxylate reductase n=1 Tax=Rubrimonas sp. TaxID=2036015 RepID=UPI002FDCC6AD